MTTVEVIERLSALPEAITAAETAVLEAETRKAAALAALQAREDALLLSGEIDGKNAEVRAAQMRQATAAERAALEASERQVTQAKLGYHRALNEFAAGRALARLLAAASD